MAVDYKDYYKTLGVSENAGQKEIRSAYRKLARQYHPDVNPGDKTAEDKFKEINEANEVLSDPEKRKKYDEMRTYYQKYGRWPGAEAGAGGGATDGGFAGGNYQYRTMSEEDLEDLSVRSRRSRNLRQKFREPFCELSFRQDATHHVGFA